jgi:uncharacterized membrane protein
MERGVRQPENCCCREHRRASVWATIVVGLLCGVQVGCGGGSSGMPSDGGPPPQVFTTIDVAEAGTSSEQGTIALVVNLKGDVAGYYYDANGFIHGFIRNAAGAITTVDVPGDGNQGANISGIDAAGDTVGAYFDALEDEHSFVRSADGTITTFDPPNSNPGSGAQSINDNGTVAGGFLDSNGAHGYLRAPDGTFTTFDPTGSGAQIEIVIPFQITASGAVAGTYTDINYVRHGFLRDSSGSITILDAPGAVAEVNFGTDILGMNPSGTIVGGIGVGVVNGIGATHSLVRTADGTYTIFDPPQAGGHSSLAEAINDSGTVVGIYRDANLVRHGYLRQPDGTFVSFDDPNAAQLPLSATSLGTDPRGINVNGAVAGFYTDANGVRHGFIWQ